MSDRFQPDVKQQIFNPCQLATWLMAETVSVTYSVDIRPKFRPQDIACMTPKGVHLADPQWMCDPGGGSEFSDHGNARRAYAALSQGFMPPDGAWPQDWLDTYSDWMTGGFQP